MAPDVVPPRAVAPERSATSRPRISSVAPAVAAPDSVLVVSGYALGAEDFGSLRVLFVQGTVERTARILGSGRTLSGDPDNESQRLETLVPADLTPGRWQLVINAHGRRSDPVAQEISHAADVRLTGISPARPHPAQLIILATSTPARASDQVHLTDARGHEWRLATGVSPLGIIPSTASSGDWRLVVGMRDGRTPAQEITTLRMR